MKKYIISIYFYDNPVPTSILRPVTLTKNDYKVFGEGSIEYQEFKYGVDHYFYGKFNDIVNDESLHKEIIKFGVKTLHKKTLIYEVDEEQMAMLILAYS